jgi:hypothetical protein
VDAPGDLVLAPRGTFALLPLAPPEIIEIRVAARFAHLAAPFLKREH